MKRTNEDGDGGGRWGQGRAGQEHRLTTQARPMYPLRFVSCRSPREGYNPLISQFCPPTRPIVRANPHITRGPKPESTSPTAPTNHCVSESSHRGAQKDGNQRIPSPVNQCVSQSSPDDLCAGRASRMPPHAQRATSTPNQPVHANKPTTTRVTTYTTRHTPTQSVHPTNPTANPACHHIHNTPHQHPAQPTRTNLRTGAMHATTHTTTANARCLTGTLRCSRLAQLGAWRLCHKVGGGRDGQHNITGGVVTRVWYSCSTSSWSSCSSTRPVHS